MFDSTYLGRFFALYLLLIGVLFLVRPNTVRTIIHEIAKNPALIAITGLVSLLFGLLFVLAHNKWEWNWHVLITILSYLLLVQGIVRLFVPEWTKQVAHHFDDLQKIMVTGFAMTLLGIFLLICTFIHLNTTT